jgi:hypothetical protein
VRLLPGQRGYDRRGTKVLAFEEYIWTDTRASLRNPSCTVGQFPCRNFVAEVALGCAVGVLN